MLGSPFLGISKQYLRVFREPDFQDQLEIHEILKTFFCSRYAKVSVDSSISVKPQYMAVAIK